MSNVSNRHAMGPFNAGDKALSGQRLAKVGYKQTEKMTKAGQIAPASVCVSVPPVDMDALRERAPEFMPYLRVLVETTQDNIVRSLYESAGHVCRDITDDDISLSACLSYLAAESAGDKLTKEMIAEWFDTEVSDNLTVWVAEKLGFTDLDAAARMQIGQQLAAYKGVFCGLSVKDYKLTEKQCVGLKNAITLSAGISPVGVKLAEKVDAQLIALKTATEMLI
jgi:hypothetical protein